MSPSSDNPLMGSDNIMHLTYSLRTYARHWCSISVRTLWHPENQVPLTTYLVIHMWTNHSLPHHAHIAVDLPKEKITSWSRINDYHKTACLWQILSDLMKTGGLTFLYYSNRPLTQKRINGLSYSLMCQK